MADKNFAYIRRVLKQLGAILILFLLIFGTSAYYPLFFKLQQRSIRRQVKHKLIHNLSDKELTLFTFSTKQLSEIQWSKKGKEFDYGASRYDIVRRRTIGDTTYYYCYEDKEESALVGKLRRFVQEEMTAQSAKNQSTYSSFFRILSSLFFSPQPDYGLSGNTVLCPFSIPHQCFLSDGHRLLFSPPPQNLV